MSFCQKSHIYVLLKGFHLCLDVLEASLSFETGLSSKLTSQQLFPGQHKDVLMEPLLFRPFITSSPGDEMPASIADQANAPIVRAALCALAWYQLEDSCSTTSTCKGKL